MRPDQQLLDNFHKGKCTPQQAKEVMDWLLENESPLPGDWQESNERQTPGNRQAPEDQQAPDNRSTPDDWEETPATGNYPEEYPGEMLSVIRANTFRKITPVRRIPWKKMAAAASIVIIAGLSLLTAHQEKKSDLKKTAVVSGNQNPATPTTRLPKAHWKTIQAPAGHPSTLSLADGSTAILTPGAILRYDPASYNKKDRTLYLEGQAQFNVAADKTRPFSVNANGFSTIALGTSFMVTARSSNDLTVKLYSGKVVVRHTGTPQLSATQQPTTLPALKDVYLLPGEELVCSNDVHQQWTSHVEHPKTRSSGDLLARKGIRMSGDSLVFDNAPLAEVLNVFQRQYQVTIQYERNTVSGVYFSGYVLPGDPIETILKTIARINKLTLVVNDGGFVIK